MATSRNSRVLRTIPFILIVVLSLLSWAYPVAGVVIYDADFDGEPVGPLSTQPNTGRLPLNLPTNTIRDSGCHVDVVASAGNLSNKPVLLDSVPGGLASAAFYNPSKLTSGQWQISWDSLVLETPVDTRSSQANVTIIASSIWGLKYNNDGCFLVQDAAGYHSVGNFIVGLSDHFDFHLNLYNKTYILDINGSTVIEGQLLGQGEFELTYFRSNGRGFSEDLAPFAFDNLRVSPFYAKYGGGSGTGRDPYLIYTAEQMNEIGLHEEDWDKRFKLMDDIDLSNFTETDFNIIGYWFSPEDNKPFTGVFDGNGKKISNFSYTSTIIDNIGLFGYVIGVIKDLGLIEPNINAGTAKGLHSLVGYYIGSLVGYSKGTITNCYVEGGSVSGSFFVGGLVGGNDYGTITNCYSNTRISTGQNAGGLVSENYNNGTISNCSAKGSVSGWRGVGGLVGSNWDGTITNCYSSSNVSGDLNVGGLMGENYDTINNCYATGSISGNERVGGIVGLNQDTITNCYFLGDVKGTTNVGGLVGENGLRIPSVVIVPGKIINCYSVGSVTGGNFVGGLVGTNSSGGIMASFWDTQNSGQDISDGGIGKTTTEMQTASTFLEAGWDFVDETDNGTEDIWKISEGLDYPRLWWEKYSGGTGEPHNPYRIATAEDLMLLGETPDNYDKHFILTADIDLDPNLPGRKVFDRAVIAPDTDSTQGWNPYDGTHFTGVFNGNGHTISHLTIKGDSFIGLFGSLSGRGIAGAIISNLYLEAVDVNGAGDYVGGLVGGNSGSITTSYSTGKVVGEECVGGLVGKNTGIFNHGTMNYSTIESCYSSVDVSGVDCVGGLVGTNLYGTITNCYATGSVVASPMNWWLPGGVGSGLSGGGLVGENWHTISYCYATGSVVASGTTWTPGIGGGLAGENNGEVMDSFWDTQASGQTVSGGGTGKTTVEMQNASTFLEVSWDFVGETDNGTEDIWWILEGQDYPRLWWELIEDNPIP